MIRTAPGRNGYVLRRKTGPRPGKSGWSWRCCRQGCASYEAFTVNQLRSRHNRREGGAYRFKPAKFLREVWQPVLMKIRRARAPRPGSEPPPAPISVAAVPAGGWRRRCRMPKSGSTESRPRSTEILALLPAPLTGGGDVGPGTGASKNRTAPWERWGGEGTGSIPAMPPEGHEVRRGGGYRKSSPRSRRLFRRADGAFRYVGRRAQIRGGGATTAGNHLGENVREVERPLTQENLNAGGPDCGCPSRARSNAVPRFRFGGHLPRRAGLLAILRALLFGDAIAVVQVRDIPKCSLTS